MAKGLENFVGKGENPRPEVAKMISKETGVPFRLLDKGYAYKTNNPKKIKQICELIDKMGHHYVIESHGNETYGSRNKIIYIGRYK